MQNEQFYIVRRKGSDYLRRGISGATPKLYKLGDARRIVTKDFKRRDEIEEHRRLYPSSYTSVPMQPHVPLEIVPVTLVLGTPVN